MPSVFLSPSTQEFNPYINGGNEEKQMNLIADEMEPYLRSSGISFTRNEPKRGVKGAISDSNANHYDVHFALHSNAGDGELAGKLTGIDVYFSPYSAKSQQLANDVVISLKDIYPTPSKVKSVPTTSLGEISRTKAVAILAELGYHDNIDDEKWIKDNSASIAKKLVEALCSYFGIPFVEAQEPQNGTVTTDGSNLNLRSYPSLSGRIITVMPNKAILTIYGRTGNWYVVNYKGKTGYAAADYVIAEKNDKE